MYILSLLHSENGREIFFPVPLKAGPMARKTIGLPV